MNNYWDSFMLRYPHAGDLPLVKVLEAFWFFCHRADNNKSDELMNEALCSEEIEMYDHGD